MAVRIGAAAATASPFLGRREGRWGTVDPPRHASRDHRHPAPARDEGCRRRRRTAAAVRDGRRLHVPRRPGEDGEDDAAALHRELEEEYGRDRSGWVGSCRASLSTTRRARTTRRGSSGSRTARLRCVRRTPRLSIGERRGLHELRAPWDDAIETTRAVLSPEGSRAAWVDRELARARGARSGAPAAAASVRLARHALSRRRGWGRRSPRSGPPVPPPV